MGAMRETVLATSPELAALATDNANDGPIAPVLLASVSGVVIAADTSNTTVSPIPKKAPGERIRPSLPSGTSPPINGTSFHGVARAVSNVGNTIAPDNATFVISLSKPPIAFRSDVSISKSLISFSYSVFHNELESCADRCFVEHTQEHSIEKDDQMTDVV